MKRMLAMACRMLMAMWVVAASAAPVRTPVVVAADPWEPLIVLDRNGVPRGPIADFLARMNAVQSRFDFQVNIVPRRRLNQMFVERNADVYPLRNIAWTEPALNLEPSKAIALSRDIYIAHRDNAFGGAKVFEDLGQRTLVGVAGYHYRVFNNNPDAAYIRANFRAELLPSNDSVVKFILAKRGDVGIVPEAIVAAFLKDRAIKAQLIVGKRPDSQVELSNLVRRGGPIRVDEMNAIIDLLTASGDVQKLRNALSIAE